MTDIEKTLLPCPFCGDAMEISGTIIRHRKKTGCVINLQAWDESAVADWNKRSEAAALRDRIATLEKALEPFAVEGDKWAAMWEDEHAPALHPKGNVCGSCGIEPDCDVAGFTVGDLRRASKSLADKGRAAIGKEG
jgi:hypothetical protein